MKNYNIHKEIASLMDELLNLVDFESDKALVRETRALAKIMRDMPRHDAEIAQQQRQVAERLANDPTYEERKAARKAAQELRRAAR